MQYANNHVDPDIVVNGHATELIAHRTPHTAHRRSFSIGIVSIGTARKSERKTIVNS